jgi:large subunit ribosomal protein L37Ae
MGNTKKVKTAGRYGSRYGVGIKKRLIDVEKRQKNLSACPFCGFSKVSRVAAGLFTCKKCSAKFTGGSYQTETLIGKTIKKIVNQKSFAANEAKLVELQSKTTYDDIESEVAKSAEGSE